MHRAFVDSDVILDFLLGREPFSLEAGQLFSLAERGRLQLFTSTIALLNVHYVASRLTDSSTSQSKLRELRQLLTLLPVTEAMIDHAFASTGRDLEDLVQYNCAERHDLGFLITRNTRDFSDGAVTVITPEDFLQSFRAVEREEH